MLETKMSAKSPQTPSESRITGLKRRCSALAVLACLGLAPQAVVAAEATMLVQLNDYEGDAAYFSLYLVDPSGRYVRTLWVSGDEERWYAEQPRWWKYVGRAPQDLDAITGASTKSGDRAVIRFDLEDDILDAGYKVRVDTSVEDQQNHPLDVEAPLETALQGEKIPGTGYVRYLRYKW
jgi:hypothetical protein